MWFLGNSTHSWCVSPDIFIWMAPSVLQDYLQPKLALVNDIRTQAGPSLLPHGLICHRWLSVPVPLAPVKDISTSVLFSTIWIAMPLAKPPNTYIWQSIYAYAMTYVCHPLVSILYKGSDWSHMFSAPYLTLSKHVLGSWMNNFILRFQLMWGLLIWDFLQRGLQIFKLKLEAMHSDGLGV